MRRSALSAVATGALAAVTLCGQARTRPETPQTEAGNGERMPEPARGMWIETADPLPAPAPGLDIFGDPLPPGAVARLGTSRLRPGAMIDDVAFSPDGSRLAVTDESGAVSVWATETGRLVGRTKPGLDAAVAFGPDGETVGAVGPGAGLRVFDRGAMKLVRAFDSDLPVGGRGMAPDRQPSPVLAPGLRWLAFGTGEDLQSALRLVDLGTRREL